MEEHFLLLLLAPPLENINGKLLLNTNNFSFACHQEGCVCVSVGPLRCLDLDECWATSLSKGQCSILPQTSAEPKI